MDESKKKTLQHVKASLEIQLACYNQLWQKYWMNAQKTMQVGCQKKKRKTGAETPHSPAFHSALLSQGYPLPWVDLALG